MATKLAKMVTYFDGCHPLTSHYSLITWSCEIMWQTKTAIFSLSKCLWPSNLAWWLPTLIGSCLESHTTLWSRSLLGSRDKLKPLFLHYRSPMATKRGRKVTYVDGLQPITSHGSLITWSCEITWQPKIIISPLPQCQWPPDFASCWLTMRGFHS